MSLHGDFIGFLHLLRVDDGDHRSDCSCVGFYFLAFFLFSSSFLFLFMFLFLFVAGY